MPFTCNVWNEHLEIHMHNNAYIQKAKQAALQKRYETLLIFSNHGQSNFVFNIYFK